MKIEGVEFPESLLSALRNHRLVVFAGAGVSRGQPAGLPSFEGLVEQLERGSGLSREEGETDDRFLGRLKNQGTEIYRITTQILSADTAQPTSLHRDLLRIQGDVQNVRIVTTNFDLLFENAAGDIFLDQQPEVFRAPALPLGNNFKGIVHLHGSVLEPDQMVLTDEDFGRAYIAENWAGKFLVDLFREYTVLFVGYSHDDVMMNYLSKALAEKRPGTRFSLTSGDSGFWEAFGITPIVYLNSNNHEALYKSIGKLSEIINWNILNWQPKMIYFANKPPPDREEDRDLLMEGLRDEERAKFFTKTARLTDWIDWLNQQGYLERLFLSERLTRRDELFSYWVADNFIIEHADKLQLLIGKHGMNLNPTFWRILGKEIALTKKDISNNLLSQWVSLLLATIPGNIDYSILQFLGERCAKTGLINALLQIFNVLTETHFLVKPNLFAQMEKQDDDIIDIDVFPRSESYVLEDIWNKIKLNIAQIAEPALRKIITELEKRHATEISWQKADRGWEPASFRRSAIEPHEQDEYPEATDILINAARDCLEWLGEHKPSIAAGWCDQLIEVDVPLLRRLAVHILSKRIDLTANKKLEWLLQHIDIHETSSHHEIFQVVRAVYPKADEKTKLKFIEAVYKYEPPDSYEDKDRLSASVLLNWFYWLSESDPNCDLAKRALEKAKAQYPDMQPSEYPDLLHWMSSGDDLFPRIPWTPKELSAKPAKDWLPELLDYKSWDHDDGVRHDLVSLIAETAKDYVEWGFALAQALTDEEKWDSDIWIGLLQTWSELDLSDENYKNQILHRFEEDKLYSPHHRSIANFLLKLVENGGKPYTPAILPQLNKIGENLWPHINASDHPQERNGFLMDSINHSSGVLAQFFMHSISIWRRELGENKPERMTDEYRKILLNMIDGDELKFIWAISILASSFNFLQAVDEEWAKQNLLPCFDRDKDINKYKAAWDGFLHWGRLSPNSAELLSDMFLKTVEHIEGDFSDEIPNRFEVIPRFIGYYIDMIGYFVDNPFEPWISKFFQNSSIRSRVDFAKSIAMRLRRMEGNQKQKWWDRWLRQYWENRLSGIPVGLDPQEAAQMVAWVSCLSVDLFPKTVNLAIQMPPPGGYSSHFLSDLSKGDQPSLYPEETAKFLLYLNRSGAETNIGMRRYGREIIQKIPQGQLSTDLERQLRELKVRLGF